MNPKSKIEYGVRITCAHPECLAHYVAWGDEPQPLYQDPPDGWYGHGRLSYCAEHAAPVVEWHRALSAHGQQWQHAFHAASNAYRDALAVVPAKPPHPYLLPD